MVMIQVFLLLQHGFSGIQLYLVHRVTFPSDTETCFTSVLFCKGKYTKWEDAPNQRISKWTCISQPEVKTGFLGHRNPRNKLFQGLEVLNFRESRLDRIFIQPNYKYEINQKLKNWVIRRALKQIKNVKQHKHIKQYSICK